MKKRWNTGSMITFLKQLELHGATVRSSQAGGDYDTSAITIEPEEGDPLFLCGFNCDDPVDAKDDADVEMLELSDGLDSRGGLNSSDPITCAIFGTVISALRRAGWQVVGSMDEYF